MILQQFNNEHGYRQIFKTVLYRYQFLLTDHYLSQKYHHPTVWLAVFLSLKEYNNHIYSLLQIAFELMNLLYVIMNTLFDQVYVERLLRKTCIFVVIKYVS